MMKKSILVLIFSIMIFADLNAKSIDTLSYDIHYFSVTDEQKAAYHMALEEYEQLFAMLVNEKVNDHNFYRKFSLLSNIIYNPISLGLADSNNLNNSLVKLISDKMNSKKQIIVWAGNGYLIESLRAALLDKGIRQMEVVYEEHLPGPYLYDGKDRSSNLIITNNYRFYQYQNLVNATYLIAHIPGQALILNRLIDNIFELIYEDNDTTVEFMIPNLQNNLILEILRRLMTYKRNEVILEKKIYQDIFNDSQLNKSTNCTASLNKLLFP